MSKQLIFCVIIDLYVLWTSFLSSQYYFVLDGNTGDKFTINEASGQVSASNLDFDTLDTYTLVIAAKDLNGAAGALETTVNAIVNVKTGTVIHTYTKK